MYGVWVDERGGPRYHHVTSVPGKMVCLAKVGGRKILYRKARRFWLARVKY